MVVPHYFETSEVSQEVKSEKDSSSDLKPITVFEALKSYSDKQYFEIVIPVTHEEEEDGPSLSQNLSKG